MVLGSLGDIGQSVRDIVWRAFPDVQVLGADSRADTGIAGSFRMKPASHPGYLAHLADVVRDERIDVLIPSHEAEIKQLASINARDTLGCDVLVEASETVEMFADKLSTYNWCAANSIPTPTTQILHYSRHLEFPSLLKPRIGSGGKGQIIVNSRSDLDLIESRDEYVVQPLLQGAQEFTCVLARRSETTVLLTLERRLDGGRSRWICVSDDGLVSDAARTVAQLLRPNFSINFQFLRTETEALLIDVNPRFSSTVAMRDRIGFSDLCWSLERTLNQVLSPYEPPVAGTVVEWLDDNGKEFRVQHTAKTLDA
jgi:carbamoyl-phosphate synthase large subunit